MGIRELVHATFPISCMRGCSSLPLPVGYTIQREVGDDPWSDVHTRVSNRGGRHLAARMV
jgi:hypothetical protein